MQLLAEHERTWNNHFACLQKVLSAFWLFKVVEDAVSIRHNFLIGGKQAMICIHHRCFFIQVACAYKPVISIPIIYPFLDDTEFGMYFQIWKSRQYFRSLFFEAILPFEICFLIKSCS